MADDKDKKESPSAEATEDKETKETKESKEDTKESKSVDVSPKLAKLIEEVEKLSVLELADLVKALEDKFGVSATAVAAPMAVGAAPAGGEAEGGAGGGEEQTTFNVVLADGGANKISVIKAVRELVPSLGLKDAKELVESAPKPVLEGVGKDAANEAKQKLEAAGAKVELK